MTDRPRVHARIERRETHVSRAVPAILVAVVLVLALAYLAAETVLAALGRPALLASPATMVADLRAVVTVPVPALAASGTVLGILGVVLLVLALSAGRRPRHVLRNDRAVVVVDDEVIASALVRAVADAGDLDPDRALGTVSRRTAVVDITPTSGVAIDRDALHAAATEQLRSWSLTPTMRSRIRVRASGKVGA